MKYVQCFYQYPVTFSAIGKTFPANGAQGELRNLAEVTDKELDKLMNCEPFFRELVDKKKYRILTHMPESYKTSASRINEANDEIARLKAENEKLKAQAKAEEPKAEVIEEEVIEAHAEEAKTENKKATSSKKGKK